jgi:hypothetical protein
MHVTVSILIYKFASMVHSSDLVFQTLLPRIFTSNIVNGALLLDFTLSACVCDLYRSWALPAVVQSWFEIVKTLVHVLYPYESVVLVKKE